MDITPVTSANTAITPTPATTETQATSPLQLQKETLLRLSTTPSENAPVPAANGIVSQVGCNVNGVV